MNRPKLIDTFLPEYSFRECHDTVIKGTMADVYAATENFDLSKSRLITWLFMLRGLPTRRMHLQDFISDIGFTPMAENPPMERLIAFWAIFKIVPIPNPQDFINNTISPRVKVVWNFYIDPLEQDQKHAQDRQSDHVRLCTETRIQCLTLSAKLFFGLYWAVIRPFSGIIRKKMLNIIKQDCEAAQELPQ